MPNLPHGFDIDYVNIKTMRKIGQMSVAFSEKLNFNRKHGQGTQSTKMGAQPKIPRMPQKISAQFVCPSPKVWDF